MNDLFFIKVKSMRIKCLILFLLLFMSVPAKPQNLLKNYGVEEGNLRNWDLGILGDKKGKFPAKFHIW